MCKYTTCQSWLVITLVIKREVSCGVSCVLSSLHTSCCSHSQAHASSGHHTLVPSRDHATRDPLPLAPSRRYPTPLHCSVYGCHCCSILSLLQFESVATFAVLTMVYIENCVCTH